MQTSNRSSFYIAHDHARRRLSFLGVFLALGLILSACKPVSTTSTPTSKKLSSTMQMPTIAQETLETKASTEASISTLPPLQTTPSASSESPTLKPTKHELDTSTLLDTLDSGVDWHVLIKDLDSSETLLAINADQSFNPASMIKIPIAMAVLNKNKELGRSLNDLQKIGIKGRSFGALLYAMVVKSEEPATQILENFAWGDDYLRLILDSWGIEKTFFDPRRSTCKDLAIALEGLHKQSILDSESNQYLIDLMLEQTENDSKYLGVLKESLPGSSFANKRGTLTGPTVVADHGIFSYKGKTWIIIIAGTPDDSDTANFDTIAASIERFAKALAGELEGLAVSQP